MIAHSVCVLYVLQYLVLVFLAAAAALFRECACSVDEFMTCDRLFESKRTARVLEQIPCDMTRQTYCEHKGAAYPE